MSELPPDPHLIPACKRVKVNQLAPGVWAAGKAALIPTRWAERLEQDQKLASCCRHPENHTISAWYSCAKDAAKGVPDIYIFHCDCGRVHRRFCVGQNPSTPEQLADWEKEGRELERRPFWDIR